MVASTLKSISRTVVSGLEVPGPANPVVTVSKAPTSWTEMMPPDSQLCPVRVGHGAGPNDRCDGVDTAWPAGDLLLVAANRNSVRVLMRRSQGQGAMVRRKLPRLVRTWWFT